MNKGKIIFILFVSISWMVSCKLFKIEVSDKRNPEPQIILLDNQLEVSPTGAVRISKSDFFSSGIRIKSESNLIYIDPLAITDTDKADYIFITHGHPDHFSMRDIRKIAKPETLIICPKNVAKKLSRYDCKIREVKPGDLIDLDVKLEVEVVEAYNLHNAFLWLKAHPKSNLNAGYILNMNKVRIYHTGDTDYVPEMETIRDISLILVPVGGDNLTMAVEDAASLVNQIKPKFAVPMHYDMKERLDLERFRLLIDKSVEVRVLE
jgi:L-ascorbate metabolism protein UlaG (beta-lactamase superfamily)